MEEEAEEWRASHEGAHVPVSDVCPNYTVAEVFALDRDGKAIWDDSILSDDHDDKRVRLFVCLVVDAFYRNCTLSAVPALWELMVAADLSTSSLFGQTCHDGDVLVTMLQVHRVGWVLALRIPTLLVVVISLCCAGT